MPIELNDLILKRTRTLAIPLNDEGEALTIRWNPTNLNQATYARLQEWYADDAKTDPFEVAEYLICPLVTGWDITVDGKPHPITPETVGALGLPLVTVIAKALQADTLLAADAKKDSAAA